MLLSEWALMAQSEVANSSEANYKWGRKTKTFCFKLFTSWVRTQHATFGRIKSTSLNINPAVKPVGCSVTKTKMKAKDKQIPEQEIKTQDKHVCADRSLTFYTRPNPH